jgi:hypothetical protein
MEDIHPHSGRTLADVYEIVHKRTNNTGGLTFLKQIAGNGGQENSI